MMRMVRRSPRLSHDDLGGVQSSSPSTIHGTVTDGTGGALPGVR